MEGIVIRYEYQGDEENWRTAVDGFIANINNDAEIAGKFRYSVNVGADGKTRIHVGRWPDQATLETLQSRDYFKAFATKVQEFGGDSLSPMRVSEVTATAG